MGLLRNFKQEDSTEKILRIDMSAQGGPKVTEAAKISGETLAELEVKRGGKATQGCHT